MNFRNIIWTPVVKEKLIKFRNERFTAAETLNYIYQIIIETEEFGKYRGISRIVIRKFNIYYKQINDDIVIIGVLFPGENK